MKSHLDIHFCQSILIGDRISHTVFSLPCVMSARKDADGKFYYTLFGDTITDLFRWGDTIVAFPGDWLCEDYDGRWHLLNDAEYQDHQKSMTRQ